MYDVMFVFVFQISESIPLVGELEAISSLEKEYNEDPVYLLKVKDLASKYKYMRRTRPDGNCFFRAFSYAYLEYLLTDKAEYEKFFEIAKNSKEILLALGFSQFTVEDFYETVSLFFRLCFFVSFAWFELLMLVSKLFWENILCFITFLSVEIANWLKIDVQWDVRKTIVIWKLTDDILVTTLVIQHFWY